jgi:ubiquinone/menaquinone biosynthesis C-methylase UbiE
MPPDKHMIKEKYDQLGGKIYDQRYSEEQQAKYQIINQLLQSQPTDIILDDGCGTGLFVTQQQNTIIGIDLSTRLLCTARKRTKNQLNKHLAQADAENLPIKDEIFNQTVLITVIQNIPNQFKTITEMKRVTKKGGTIIITAHKKTIKPEELEKIIQETNLLKKITINNTTTNDFIIITEKS